MRSRVRVLGCEGRKGFVKQREKNKIKISRHRLLMMKSVLAEEADAIK
jgi:hypothetical protein